MIFTCLKCKKEKSLDSFKKNKSKKHGIDPTCKQCVREYRQRPEIKEMNLRQQKVWRAKNPDKNAQYGKNFRSTEYGKRCVLNDNLRVNYGITLEKYEELFAAQNGNCKICEKNQKNFSKRLHVDHDHTTGVIRGLLCHHCNTGLGLFKENEKLLHRAVKYIKQNEGVKL